jgi:hypothetical protein
MPPLSVSIRYRWPAALAVAVLLAEGGFWAFRHLGWRAPEGAGYSWPAALTLPPAAAADLDASLRLYQADRGANPAIAIGPGRHLVAYYFEWDGLKSSITTPAGGHLPEVCNTARGYQFNGVLPTRSWSGPGGSVDFEVTHFLSPAGEPVYVFKNIWFRGLGNWENRQIVKPWQRLGVLARHRREEVRLLTAGVFGMGSPDAAWQAFSDHVLRHLSWHGLNESTTSRPPHG